MRTGLIGKKLGMTRVLAADGEHISVTLVQVKDCQVVDVRTAEKDGYTAVQLGTGSVKANRLAKPQKGFFAKQKIDPKKKLIEFRVDPSALLKVGDELSVEHFVKGQLIDASAVSIGKGFAGVMKRHNFAGLRASHGVSLTHRSGGSTGMCQDPGKVFKGTKMAGQMGNKRVTVQNLEVVATDVEDGIIAIKGAVPGARGSYIELRDAVKKQKKVDLPFPAALLSKTGSAPKAEPVVEAAAPMESPVVDEATSVEKAE